MKLTNNMTHTVKITKKGNESTPSILRRFTRAVKLSGMIKRARSTRYAIRPKSDATKKKDALRRIAWQKDMEKQQKLGKIGNKSR